MSDDSFVEVSHESWFGRLGSAIKGVLFGGLLFIVAFPVLFWNEGRAVQTYKSLKEGEGAVISVAVDEVNSENEDKLVHLTGLATTEDKLRDKLFGISANALRLERNVQMYQWEETKHTRTKKTLGGGKTKITEYRYNKEWSPSLISSSNFRKSGHTNPKSMPVKSSSIYAGKVNIGDFEMTKSLITKIDNYESLPVNKLPEKIPEKIQGRLKLSAGGFYLGDTPAVPKVGDVKISYKVVNPQEVSLIAQQSGKSFRPFQTKAGDPIELLQTGSHSAKEMFKQAQASNEKLTWILRAVGFVLMFIGLIFVLNPLSVFADVIPFVGSAVGFMCGVISFLVAAPLSLITIGIAWIVYRPLLGIGLIAGAVLIASMLFVFKGSKKARMAY